MGRHGTSAAPDSPATSSSASPPPPSADVGPGAALVTHGIGPAKPQGGRPAKGRERRHIEDRRALAESLDLNGATVRQIAEQCGVSVATAFDDLKAIAKVRRTRLGVFDIESATQREWDRLEAQRRWLTPAASAGNVAANRALTRVSESQRKLVGMDAPERVTLVQDPYDTLRTGLGMEQLAALATRQPGQRIIDVVAVEADEFDPDPDEADEDDDDGMG